MNQIDLGRSLKALFADKDWVTKTLLGFVWGLLVVTAPVVTGAQLEYIRGVSRGNEDLPDWSDFGAKWVAGLLVFVAGFVYFLPVIVLALVFALPALMAAIAGGDSDVFGALLGGSMCIFSFLAIIYTVGVSVLFSAAMTNYAMKGTFGSMFAFGEIMEKVRGGSGYFTAWLYTIVIAFIGSIVTSVLSSTGIGAVLSPAVTYLMLMASGHVLGQWAANAYAAGLAPTAATGAYPPPPPAPQPPTVPPAAPAQIAPSVPPAPPAQPEPPAIPQAAPPVAPAAPAAAPTPEAPAPQPVPPAPPIVPAPAETVAPPAPPAPPAAPAPAEPEPPAAPEEPAP